MVDLVSAKINFKFDFGCEGFFATLSLLNYQTLLLQIRPFVIQFFASFSFFFFFWVGVGWGGIDVLKCCLLLFQNQ